MNRLIFPLLLITIAVLPQQVLAGDTVSIKVSFTIPQRLEIEETKKTINNAEETEKPQLKQQADETIENITTTEKMIREGKSVLVKTIVPR